MMEDLNPRLKIASASFGGVEYGRIPDDALPDSSNGSFWFRTGIDDLILNGEIPHDFMRCPKCFSIQYRDLVKKDILENGGMSHSCQTCDEDYSDLGWAWLSALFPTREVYLAVNHYYGSCG